MALTGLRSSHQGQTVDSPKIWGLRFKTQPDLNFLGMSFSDVDNLAMLLTEGTGATQNYACADLDRFRQGDETAVGTQYKGVCGT